MPAMIGGFGKIKCAYPSPFPFPCIKGKESLLKIKNFKWFSIKANTSTCNKYTSFGPYLAGLIEADGSIAVHDKQSKVKRYRPMIVIVFSLADKPLADKLASITGVGKVYHKSDAGYVLWQIQKIQDVIQLVEIINGYMRTPKIEALHRAINWLYENNHCNIDCLPIDNSPIDSNSWLAGFSDGDANFSITLTDRKKKGNITNKRVQTFFRIELRQNYHRGEAASKSYFIILSLIAEYLNVNVYSRTRQKQDKLFFAFLVIAHSSVSHAKVRRYFDRFPLYSSKRLAYIDWCHVQDIRAKADILTKQQIEQIEQIKSGFNSKRKVYNFNHLENLKL